MLCPECHDYNGRIDGKDGRCSSCELNYRLMYNYRCLRCRVVMKSNEEVLCHECEEGKDI
jgi:hypothetical protein